MKQYIIIEKDGQKWLRPVNPFDSRDIMWQDFNLKEADLLYLGSRSVGEVVDKSEVREVRQIEYNGVWQQFKRPIPNGNYPTRTAYTDAEPTQFVDRRPLSEHLRKKHGLILTNHELDEIIALSAYILK